MVASANWVPVPVTRKARGFVRPSYKDKFVDNSDATMQQQQQQQQQQPSANRHQQQPPPVLLRIDDSDEELEPFDAESFVNQLVEDDPPPWRMGGGAVGEGARLWEAPEIFSADNKTPTEPAKYNGETTTVTTTVVSSSSSAAAKLFLHPIYSWPPAPPPAPLPCSSVDGQGSRDMPMIVPHDPILDALFTPARTSPEIVPTVTMGLVRVASAGSGGRGGRGITGFQPAAIYNIPAPVEHFSAVPLVPMAPRRRHFDDRFYEQHPSQMGGVTSGILVESAKNVSSEKPSKSGVVFSTTHHQESSKNVLSAAAGSTSAATCSTAACLIGADAFSSEYDDDQHAFLRQQELALFVGPGYLAGPGRPGLVTPMTRTVVVDWVSVIHAAAPAASGGGAPLSLEALFLTVNLLDRFFSTAEGARTAYAGGAALKVAAAACLALASKYEDTQPTSLWGVAVAATNEADKGVCGNDGGGGGGGGGYFGGNNCNGAGVGEGFGVGAGGNSNVNGSCGGNGVDVGAARKEVAAMELRVASALGFRLTVPTALSFLGVFLRRAGALGYLPEGHVSERVREEAQQILLCVLRDASSLEHPPSAIAASALYWASCVTTPGAAAPESFAFFAVTGYQLDRLCRCLRDMEGVRTGGGERHASLAGGGDRAAVTFVEHATLFDMGGGHPAIATL